MKGAFASASLLVSLFTAQTTTPTLTIPEALAQHGSSLVRVVSAPSGDLPHVESLLRNTDMVVRGVVSQIRTYLSPDEREVYTDYEIRQPQVFYQSSAVVSDKPGASGSITVTLLGGKIELNGLTFSSDHRALPSLETGREYVLWLQREERSYFISGRYFGAFRVVDGLVEPVVRRAEFASEYKDMPAGDAVATMAAIAHKAHRKE